MGDSPVGERVGTVLRKREVERDTWNPVRRRGDHPPRLNTRDRPIVNQYREGKGKRTACIQTVGASPEVTAYLLHNGSATYILWRA